MHSFWCMGCQSRFGQAILPQWQPDHQRASLPLLCSILKNPGKTTVLLVVPLVAALTLTEFRLGWVRRPGYVLFKTFARLARNQLIKHEEKFVLVEDFMFHSTC